MRVLPSIVFRLNKWITKYTNLVIMQKKRQKPKPDMFIDNVRYPIVVFTDVPVDAKLNYDNRFVYMYPNDSMGVEGIGNVPIIILPMHLESEYINLPAKQERVSL